MIHRRRCVKCGHLPCPGCQIWCDRIATVKEDLKFINYTHVIKQAKEDGEEFDSNDEGWFPIMCCDGKCKYE